MKVISVVGARPQFIKAFPVSKELRESHEEMLIHTGQHYDETLSTVFFTELGIPEPEYHLGIGSGSHGKQTGEMLIKVADILDRERPDVVLVYGDTNSTLAAAIAAAKTDAALTHVEAGLRSDNWQMPEEVNRVLTDHASDILFPPSNTSRERLASEGITKNVFEVGDVLYDALLWACDRAPDVSTILSDLGLEPEEFILCTIHRPRNTDYESRARELLTTLDETNYRVVFPVHPRMSEKMAGHGIDTDTYPDIDFIDPVGYFDFIRLLDAAYRVATDSGSIQKEAFYLDTPCITLREETEWTETVDAGWNMLAGADSNTIHRYIDGDWELIDKPTPYGDGNAARKITAKLADLAEADPKG